MTCMPIPPFFFARPRRWIFDPRTGLAPVMLHFLDIRWTAEGRETEKGVNTFVYFFDIFICHQPCALARSSLSALAMTHTELMLMASLSAGASLMPSPAMAVRSPWAQSALLQPGELKTFAGNARNKSKTVKPLAPRLRRQVRGGVHLHATDRIDCHFAHT